ncbi:MAG: hypothetical protein J6J43_09090 [Oscillospiraceae bacterium]|nr:hypothetical protein [Oscillospiraceae bacterium]
MEQTYCKDCQHFCQHYVLWQNKLVAAYCGHCTCQKRLKHKRPDAKSCPDFLRCTDDIRERFVTREYLSKALLHRILTMELLPDMETP